MNVNYLRSDILDKEIIIGSECLNNFLIDDENDFLKNTFNKKCSLCYNINIGKIIKYAMIVKKEKNVLNVKYIFQNFLLKYVHFVLLIKNQ